MKKIFSIFLHPFGGKKKNGALQLNHIMGKAKSGTEIILFFLYSKIKLVQHSTALRYTSQNISLVSYSTV
jgi:hypothetical protein